MIEVVFLCISVAPQELGFHKTSASMKGRAPGRPVGAKEEDPAVCPPAPTDPLQPEAVASLRLVHLAAASGGTAIILQAPSQAPCFPGFSTIV